MGRIADLLRWKDWVMLKDSEGNEIKKIWLRIIGDEDLNDAFRKARIASADKRKRLRDKESDDFKEQIEYIREADFDECFEVVAASRSQNLMSEALANVERPDAVKIEEIAVDADAPTLEEQEKLDAANTRVDEDYEKALGEYVDTRKQEIQAEWKAKSIEEIREQAEIESVAILALSAFFERLEEEKCWRSVYEDEECKTRGYRDVHEFRDQKNVIREQVIQAYRLLEMGADEIKNSRKVDLGEQ